MASDRLGTVLREVAASRVAGKSPVDAVCAAAAALLTLGGAGISLMVDGQVRGTAGTAEPGIAAIQELQLTLGEGPCVDAWNTGAPVLEPDLAAPARVRWAAFAQAATEVGIRAVFAFPMRLGAIRIGVLTLYRDRPGGLGTEELAHGLILADLATQTVLDLQAGVPSEALHELLAKEPAHWAEIHHATGMISVRANTTMDEAFVRLRAHAFAAGRPLREVAADVVSGRLSLESA